MLDDTQRLMGTVEQVLRAARVTQKNAALDRTRSRNRAAGAGCRGVGASATSSFAAVAGLGVGWQASRTPGSHWAIARHLSTALSNMLDNAVKYSPADPKIRVEVVTPDLEHVRICVKDNGVGIPRGELKRIFKRFYRVVATPALQVKGSGLGLFIVRTIARRHGGTGLR